MMKPKNKFKKGQNYCQIIDFVDVTRRISIFSISIPRNNPKEISAP